MNVFRIDGARYVVAPDLLAVVRLLVSESREPPRPSGLWGHQRLEVEDLGPVEEV